jgi:hypothetical protein
MCPVILFKRLQALYDQVATETLQQTLLKIKNMLLYSYRAW